MTDEEMAEEYAKANMHYEIAKRENGANYAKEVNSVTIKQAYLAGLTKAKEIIKDYLTIIKGSHTTVCGVPEENRTIHVLKLNEEAEQFIKE